MQKAISEAGSVNVISVGTGDDKSIDIEDVLPQAQVEKKIVDCVEENIVEDEVSVEKIYVTSKSEVESHLSNEKKDIETDNVKSEGKNLKSILHQVIKSKLSEKNSVVELDIKKRPVETDKENVKKQKVSNITDVVVKEQKLEINRTKNNAESEIESTLDDNTTISSEVKQVIKFEDLNNPNHKPHLVNTTLSTSEEPGVPSSSISREYILQCLNILVSQLILSVENHQIS